MKEDSAYKPMAITNISIFLLCGLMSLQKKPFWRVRTRFLGVSGELIPTTNFTLCKSTACRLSSQWPQRDQISRPLHVYSSISEGSRREACQIHSIQRSLRDSGMNSARRRVRKPFTVSVHKREMMGRSFFCGCPQ